MAVELDQRKMRILQAIIDDYILTAAPVGSSTLAKRGDFQLSAATIRNEMSGLEEMGYLEQPHTSAGRVPSNKAYRLYVNDIMQRAQLNEQEQKAIRSYFNTRITQVESLVRQTATALSDITRYTAMVLPMQLESAKIKHIQLVPLAKERVLLVLVTETGVIRDVVLRVPEGISHMDLDRFSHYLNRNLRDVRLDQFTADEILAIGDEMEESRKFLQSMMEAIGQQMQDTEKKVQLAGTTNLLFYPEYSDTTKVKNFLTALEGKDTLYQMLKRASRLEFSISIGEENEADALKDCSIVTATYRIGTEPMGTFGILGPTRMHYSHVLAILEYMQLSLSEAIAGLIEEDRLD